MKLSCEQDAHAPAAAGSKHNIEENMKIRNYLKALLDNVYSEDNVNDVFSENDVNEFSLKLIVSAVN